MLLALVLSAPLAALGPGDGGTLRVLEATTGCPPVIELRNTWVLEGDVWCLDGRAVPRERLDELRRRVFESRGEPDDLLERVGVTPEALAERLADVAVAARVDPLGRRLVESSRPPACEIFDAVAVRARAEVLGRNRSSSVGCRLRLELPGDPPIVVESRGETPWMLPWSVGCGTEAWRCADPAVSLAVLPFLDPAGPLAELLDGRTYWASDFWSDPMFWEPLRWTLESILVQDAFRRLSGHALLGERWRVDAARFADLDGSGPSVAPLLTLLARRPEAVDSVRWLDPWPDARPVATWNELIEVVDAVASAVERERWLLEWKAAGPERRIVLDVVGRRTRSDAHVQRLVERSWVDAALGGRPDVQLRLLRAGDYAATVWLLLDAAGGLVTKARPGEGSHPLDRLELTPPRYARVALDGRLEVREP